MSDQDPGYSSSEEPTRAAPRIDPSFLEKPQTQQVPQDSATREVPYGSPPPQHLTSPYGQGDDSQSYGQGYAPYSGGGYDQPQQPYQQPYAQPYQQPYAQPYQQADPYAYGPAGGFPPPQQSNAMAIAALVTSLSGCLCGVGFLVGPVLGIVALPKAKQSGDSGAKGMAIGGIVIGVIGTLAMLAYIVAVVAGAANSSS